MLQVLNKPLITEKAMKLSANGQYAFDVNPNSNKIEIKKAIEEMYEVNVESVRTVRIKGKVKARMTKKGYIRGKAPLIKKAYVTLKEGQSIEIVSGTQAE